MKQEVEYVCHVVVVVHLVGVEVEEVEAVASVEAQAVNVYAQTVGIENLIR